MRRALSLLLALLLTACGFRLVGDRPLPDALERVHVDVLAPYRVMEPPIETHLRALLLRRGSNVLDRPAPGVTEIRLSQLETRREILSVGVDGKALEFALITRVQMDVRRDSAVLVPITVIEVTRDFSFNAEQVLAKEAEEERLRRYLQTEIAELLLLRLEALLRASPAIVAPATPTDAPPAGP